MLDIESFSFAAWATPNAVSWNTRNKRGILYRGYDRVWSSEYFRADEIKRKEPERRDEGGRGLTWGT